MWKWKPTYTPACDMGWALLGGLPGPQLGPTFHLDTSHDLDTEWGELGAGDIFPVISVSLNLGTGRNLSPF